MCIFPSLIAYLFFDRGIELIGSAATGMYMNVLPLLGSGLAILFLGEELYLFHIAGMTLIRHLWQPFPRGVRIAQSYDQQLITCIAPSDLRCPIRSSSYPVFARNAPRRQVDAFEPQAKPSVHTGRGANVSIIRHSSTVPPLQESSNAVSSRWSAVRSAILRETSIR